ncbi:MAG: rhodanese-like domain-containing protein [Proteobacteria bacterium]|nr:rhodanese-like domain-containing protein [Pseudomonadota bacterium]HQR03868.1 rhodanese-like domain-containing protein [Rhodocyclaceae bacterium]
MSRLNEILTLAQERSRTLGVPYAGSLTPGEAHEVMRLTPDARLVDVRTRAEWDWVGRIPDALEIEWQGYPGGAQNPHFIQTLQHTVPSETLLLFLCRSGGRSSAAATAAAAAGYPSCYNVLEGFEGDKDAHGQRNTTGGWRFRGLPWIQS